MKAHVVLFDDFYLLKSDILFDFYRFRFVCLMDALSALTYCWFRFCLAMNKPASSFEKRYLFGYGRHFWNALGVVGFTVMATGAVYAIQGLYGLRDSGRNVNPVFSEWMCSDDWEKSFTTIYELNDFLRKDHWNQSFLYCKAYKKWILAGKKMKYREKEWGENVQSRDYISVYKPDHGIEFISVKELPTFEIISQNYHTSYLAKEPERQERQFAASVRLGLSPIIAGAGLVVVAVSSVVSAVLAIERNTRQ